MGRPKIPLDSVRYSEPHYPTMYEKPSECVSLMQGNAQNMDTINVEEFTSVFIPALRNITLKNKHCVFQFSLIYYCILRGRIKGFNRSITTILFEVGSYRTVVG